MAIKNLLWSKAIGSASTVNTSSTYASGSSTYAYVGMESDKSLKVNNVAVLAFDTSAFISTDYTKNGQLELSVLSDWYAIEKSTGKRISIDEGIVDIEVYGTSKSIDEVAKYNYSKLTANCTKKATIKEALFPYSGYKFNSSFNINYVKNKTTVFVIKAKNNDVVNCAKMYKTATKLKYTYDVSVPKVSDAGNNVSEFARTSQYVLNFKYEADANFSTPMASYSIRWVASNGASGSVALTNKALNNGAIGSHIFPANTFPGGTTQRGLTVQLYMTVNDAKGTSSGEILVKTVYCNALIPTGTATNPVGGAEIYKSKQNRFTWTYSDLGGKSQKAYKLEVTSGGVTQNVSATNANLFHDFPANFFKDGAISYYLTVTSQDNLTHRSGPYNANAILSTPTVKPTYPINEESFSKSKDVTFKWDYSDEASKQAKVEINWTCGGQSGSKTINTSDNYYTFTGYTFPEGLLTYTIKVTNADGVSATATQKAKSESSIPKVTLTFPTDGTIVNYSQSFGVTWDFSEDVVTGQKSWSLEISKNGSVVKTYSGTVEKSVTIDASELGEGNFTYKLTAKNGDDKTATATSYFVIQKATPVIEMTYPVGILVKKDAEIIFLWNYSDTPITVGQKSYKLTITKPDGTQEVIERTSANHYHKFTSGYFENGLHAYTLEVTNNDDVIKTSESYSFTAVGLTEAPTITSVSNDAKPVVSWSVGSQSAYEITIYNESNDLIYSSNVVSSESAREAHIEDFIENGKYNLRMRVINEYGYYSEYTDYSFILDAENENELGDIFATNNKAHGIEIDYIGPMYDEMYVVRRDDEKQEVLGKYKDGFVDYTASLNKNYQYAVMNYNVGIKFTGWKNSIISIPGVVIRNTSDKNDYVHLWMNDSEEFYIQKNDGRVKVMHQCLGRTYQVKEQGEWQSSSRSINGYVKKEEFERLVKMSIKSQSIMYQADNEFMICDMEISNTGNYIDGGVMVSIRLERIEE